MMRTIAGNIMAVTIGLLGVARREGDRTQNMDKNRSRLKEIRI
jgi:hypothetical protein